MYSVSFVGGNMPDLIPYDIWLYMIPNTEITNISAINYSNRIDFQLALSGSNDYAMQIFLSHSSNVSDQQYEIASDRSGGNISETYAHVSIPESLFESGETVYYVVYLYNIHEDLYQWNPETGDYFCTSGKKATEVLSLVY